MKKRLLNAAPTRSYTATKTNKYEQAYANKPALFIPDLGSMTATTRFFYHRRTRRVADVDNRNFHGFFNCVYAIAYLKLLFVNAGL